MPETCAAIVIAAKHGELIKVRDYSGITDTVGALRCKFEFRTNDWDNATMTAVFCKGNMATNPEIVDGAIGVPLTIALLPAAIENAGVGSCRTQRSNRHLWATSRIQNLQYQ